MFSKGKEEDDNFFKSNTGGLIDYLNRDSNINPYNRTYMSILRKESESIANFEDAVTALYSEEKVMPDLYSDRLNSSLFLQEYRVINKNLEDKGRVKSEKPLFESMDDFKTKLKELNFNDFIAKRFKLF